MWLYLRHSHASAVPLSAPPIIQDGAANLEAAPLVISFSCTCGKNLKAKAELAGKKVKCSQCGKAVLVPGIKAGG